MTPNPQQPAISALLTPHPLPCAMYYTGLTGSWMSDNFIENGIV